MLPVFATGPGLRQAHVRSRAAPTRGVLGPWLREANDVSSNNRLGRIQVVDVAFTSFRSITACNAAFLSPRFARDNRRLLQTNRARAERVFRGASPSRK